MPDPAPSLAARIPLALTALRALLAPVVVALALLYPAGWAFGACLVAAFVSDVFDGIVARRLGVATPGLRRLDSIADTIFYVAALFAAWHLHADAIRAHVASLVLLAALEIARYAFDLRKFGKEASYHMWSSKLWGVALFAAFFALLVFGEDRVAVPAAIWIGIVADLEGLAISATLREWRTDVPTLWHARRWRQGAGGPMPARSASGSSAIAGDLVAIDEDPGAIEELPPSRGRE